MNQYMNMLQEAAVKLQLHLSALQIDQLYCYIMLLEKWNQHYNLSAIRDPKQMMTHHILDSLSAALYLSDYTNVLDVGTGAGLPGIVLAIYFPEHQFTLLDSNGKKIRFLIQTKYDLKINNITPICARAENYRTDTCFNAIISRAVGSVQQLIDHTRQLLCIGGCWCAMKGVYPELELNELELPYQVHQLTVPGLDAFRHLVMIKHV